MKVAHAWRDAIAASSCPDVHDVSELHEAPIYKVKIWQRGALLWLAGSLATFASYAFAAQTLLLGLSSVSHATSLLSVAVIEGGTLTKRSITSASVVIGANVLVVVFGSKKSELLSAAALRALHRLAPPSARVPSALPSWNVR